MNLSNEFPLLVTKGIEVPLDLKEPYNSTNMVLITLISVTHFVIFGRMI